jgi:ArsR family transcriptional regulator, arsenate/arsenite/antimonite-responsive transcriptional repressor
MKMDEDGQMKNENEITAPLSELLSAVADPVRLRLASLIAHNGETCVCDLVDATRLTQTNVSRHLSLLRHAGLVFGRKQGLWVYYSLNKPLTPSQKQIISLVKKAIDTEPELRADLKRIKNSGC